MNDDGAREGGDDLSREAALRRFLRQQLRPMISGDELSAYVRIFKLETLKPSPVFRKFMAREAARSCCHRAGSAASCRRARTTSRRSSARSGCSGNAASSCATPSSSPARRSASRSTSAS